MFTTVIDMTYHIHTVNVNCYYGVLDGVWAIVDLKERFMDPRNLIDNLVYNFGHIFDATRDGVLWMTDTDNRDMGPFEAGYAFGVALYYAIFSQYKKELSLYK